MTTPQNITVSLEWAKKLRDCGFPQGFSGVFAPTTVENIDQILPSNAGEGSYFYWMDVRSDYRQGEPVPQVESVYCNCPMIAAAPTAEEILRMLPDILEERFSLIIFRDYNREEKKQEWCLMYEHIPNRMPLYSESSDTLANAASAMFVFLSENNLLPTP